MSRSSTRAAALAAYAAAVLIGLLALGQWVAEPMTWSDPAGWARRVSQPDVLVEAARWIGIAVAGYVLAVAGLVVLSELADAIRLVPVARVLRSVAGVVAVPALKRRLVEVTAVATIAMSSLHATGAAMAAPVPVAATVDRVAVDDFQQPVVLGARYSGFGYTAPIPSLPATMPNSASSVAVARRVPATTPTPDRSADGISTASDDIVVVERGDTLWTIATAHYGYCDARMIEAIVEANPSIDDPNLIHVGDQVRLPEVTPTPAAVVVGASWGVHTIRRGDTLWHIIDRHYGNATTDLVWDVAEYNEITDPSDIPIGTEITLPPAAHLTDTNVVPEPIAADVPVSTMPPTSTPPIPATPSVDPEHRSPSDVSESTEPAIGTTPVFPQSSPLPTPARPPVGDPPVAVAPPPIRIPSLAASTTAAPASATVSSSGVSDVWMGRSVRELIGFAGGATIAAGLLGRLAFVRRRSRRLPWPTRSTPPAVQDLETVLRNTEGLDGIEWASAALTEMAIAVRLTQPDHPAVPRLVRFDNSTGLEVLWTIPRNDAPTNWTVKEAGWAWHYPRHQPAVEVDSAFPCPALVTIGRDGDADVLLNLEAVDTVQIVGDPAGVDALVQSICLELAGSPFRYVVSVSFCGVDAPRTGEPYTNTPIDEPKIARSMTYETETFQRLCHDDGVATKFALRARIGGDDHYDPVVHIVAGDRQLDEILAARNPAMISPLVIIGGPVVLDATVITCTAEGVTVDGLPRTLAPVGITPACGELIDTALAQAAVVEPAIDTLVVGDWPDADKSLALPLNATPGCVDALGEWQVRMRILGPVTYEGAAERLTPRDCEFVTFLALHRSGRTSDSIIDALWPDGCSEQNWKNASSEARLRLGRGPDGEPLLPAVRDGRYRISDRVVTDWEQFRAYATAADRVEDAEQAFELRAAALDLIEGPPFSDVKRGYSWAFTNGLIAEISTLVATVAQHAARYAHDEGRLDDALAVLRRARRLFGQPIDCPGLYAQEIELLADAGMPTAAHTLWLELYRELSDAGLDELIPPKP